MSDDLRIDFDRGMLHFGFCGQDAIPISAEYLALLRRVLASDLPVKMLELGQRHNEERAEGIAAQPASHPANRLSARPRSTTPPNAAASGKILPGAAFSDTAHAILLIWLTGK